MTPTNTIIGLHRSTCDAIEIAMEGFMAGIVFNGRAWIGGIVDEVSEFDVPVATVAGRDYPQNHAIKTDDLCVKFSGLLSPDEIEEVAAHLKTHAATHNAKITIVV